MTKTQKEIKALLTENGFSECEIESNGYRIEIVADYDGDSPREWTNVSKMALFHKRLALPNETEIDANDYSSFSEMEADIIKEYNPIVIKPVYLYEHSGITISTSPFSCQWDSGQIGFVFIDQDGIDETGVSKNKKELEKQLDAEVETYDQYIRGDVFGYTIQNIKTCEHCGQEISEDCGSCYGFYDLDSLIEAILENID